MINNRIVSKEKAENASKSRNKKYFEISARLGINLRETVYSMIKDILKKKNFNPINILIDDSPSSEGGSCCLAKKSSKKRKSKK